MKLQLNLSNWRTKEFQLKPYDEMIQSEVLYPPVGFHFSVNFDISTSNIDIMFQEVSGLSADLESEEIAEGGENRFLHKLPKRTKYSDLTFKRGLIIDSEVLSWCKRAIENFDFEPSNIEITLLNEEHEGILTWNIINAIPKQWAISNFNATDNSIVVETMKLSYQYFRTVKL